MLPASWAIRPCKCVTARQLDDPDVGLVDHGAARFATAMLLPIALCRIQRVLAQFV
jgi:hypothetical protein